MRVQGKNPEGVSSQPASLWSEFVVLGKQEGKAILISSTYPRRMKLGTDGSQGSPLTQDIMLVRRAAENWIQTA